METILRSKILKAIWVISLFVLFTYSSDGSGQATAPTKARLMLDWFPNADHVPIYVARDKGFFRGKNLDVEILIPANPNDPPKLVAVGKVDFGISYQPSVTIARSQDLPVRSIGVLVEHPLSTIAFLKDSGIRTPADLKGKRIGYSTAPIEIILFEAVAQSVGLAKEDYTLINVSFNLTPALLTRNVDAVVGAYRNYEINELALEGMEAQYFPIEKHGVPDYYELVFITSDEMLRKNRDLAERFVAALSEAIAFTKNHPEAALQIYFDANRDVRKELDHLALRDTLSLFATTQVQSLKKWETFMEFAFERGLIQKRPSAEALFENLVE